METPSRVRKLAMLTIGLALPITEALGITDDAKESVERVGVPSPTTAHTLLYIEDNAANLKLIEKALVRRPGLTLHSVMQGSLGLDLAREHRPDLILLDLHLPDMPGEDVLRHLQSDPRTQGIPVIVISADATPGQARRLIAAGARAYLTKPLDIHRFFAVVEEALSEHAGPCGLTKIPSSRDSSSSRVLG